MLLTDGLISNWKLEEVSGTRNDAHGTNHLTDNNTVGQAVGKLGFCGDFVAANVEWLSRASNASLQSGDIPLTVAAWVKLTTKTGYSEIALKDDNSTAREYGIYYDQPTDRFGFLLSSDGSSVVIELADALGPPSAGVWYYVIGWHDDVANTINIQVNNGGIDSASHATGILAGGADFTIGALQGGGGPADAQIDSISLWKRVLTGHEKTRLYGAGFGLEYPFSGPSFQQRTYRPAPYRPGIAR